MSDLEHSALIAETASEVYRHDLIQAKYQIKDLEETIQGIRLQMDEADLEFSEAFDTIERLNLDLRIEKEHISRLHASLIGLQDQNADLQQRTTLLNEGLAPNGAVKIKKALECFERARAIGKQIDEVTEAISLGTAEAAVQREEADARSLLKGGLRDMISKLRAGVVLSDIEVDNTLMAFQVAQHEASLLTIGYHQSRAALDKLKFQLVGLKEEAALMRGYGRGLVREAYEQPPAEPGKYDGMTPDEKLSAINLTTMLED